MRFDLQPAHGPYVIVGRPRSGSRVVARLCAANGVFLGADLTGPPMDSWSWYQRFTVPLISSRYFPDFDERACPELLAYCEERIQECWPRYWNGSALGKASASTRRCFKRASCSCHTTFCTANSQESIRNRRVRDTPRLLRTGRSGLLRGPS